VQQLHPGKVKDPIRAVAKRLGGLAEIIVEKVYQAVIPINQPMRADGLIRVSGSRDG